MGILINTARQGRATKHSCAACALLKVTNLSRDGKKQGQKKNPVDALLMYVS